MFLSRFEFINELLFPTAASESSAAGTATAEKKRQNLARKKIRKDWIIRFGIILQGYILCISIIHPIPILILNLINHFYLTNMSRENLDLITVISFWWKVLHFSSTPVFIYLAFWWIFWPSSLILPFANLHLYLLPVGYRMSESAKETGAPVAPIAPGYYDRAWNDPPLFR